MASVLAPAAAAAGTATCAGSWQVASSENVTGQNTGFAAVAAVPGGGAWAVGTPSTATTYADPDYRPLVEAWTGTGWRVTPSPALTAHTELLGVAAASGTAAWAVGDARPTPLSYHYRAVLERWDGQRWATVPVPQVGTAANSLQAVATGPGGTAWAVGWYHGRAHPLPLVLRSRGGSWTRVASPVVPDGQLNGVTVAPDGSIWAVGVAAQSSPTGHIGVIEHRVNGRWVRVPAPADVDNLSAVTATAGGDVWVVGTVGTVYPQPLLLRNHHGRWTTVQSPHVDQAGWLTAATARSDTDIWAVGSAYPPHGSGPRQSLIEHWNGSTVTVVANPSEGRPYLSGVTALTDGTVLAVGGQHPTGRHPRYHTYAEARCGS